MFTPEYETAEQSREADAIRDAELLARACGLDLEHIDYVNDDSGKVCWRFQFDAWPEDVGAALMEAGAEMERKRRKRK